MYQPHWVRRTAQPLPLNDLTWSSPANNHQQLRRRRIREVPRITNCQNYRETRFQKYPRLPPAEIADGPR